MNPCFTFCIVRFATAQNSDTVCLVLLPMCCALRMGENTCKSKRVDVGCVCMRERLVRPRCVDLSSRQEMLVYIEIHSPTRLK
jgi:hypothetical protein